MTFDEFAQRCVRSIREHVAPTRDYVLSGRCKDHEDYVKCMGLIESVENCIALIKEESRKVGRES